MNIFLAGASGFVGARVLEDLLSAGHDVTALVHGNFSRNEIQRRYPAVHLVLGDASNPADMKGIVPLVIEGVVYLPGLLREFPAKGITFQGVHVEGVRNLLSEAKRVGASRWIQMSALGARANANTKYFSTKWQAEEIVRASGLDWTILRPSVIFDDRPSKRMSFVTELAKAIRISPVIPIFGDGKYRLQPVSLDDVSQTIVQSLSKPETIHQTYEFGGPDKLAYSEIARIISEAIEQKKPMLHIPFGLIEPVVSVMQGFSFFPITMDQIVMLKEENVIRNPAEDAKWMAGFQLPLKRFSSNTIGLRNT